jgi:hypothetical protein
MVITAAGFQPAVIPLVADASSAPCTIDATVPPINPNAGRVCLISIGTVNLVPLSAPAGRGTIAGSIFGSNGLPLDGATVVVSDASGLVHTRISGTRCDGTPIGGAVPTGFYCVEDSTGDRPNAPVQAPPAGGPLSSPFGFVDDSLGLPVGPATVTVVNNTASNCIGTLGGGAVAGNPCGYLPATTTVSVAAGVVVGQDITLQNKFAPAAGVVAGAAGTFAFGYVVNAQGQGVGGIIITATGAGVPAGTVGVCPVPPAGTVGTTVAPPGTCTQTGLWIMTGLPVATTVTFTITGPSINPNGSNVRSAPIGANNPITGANTGAPISVTRTTAGAAGSWVDPSWVIITQGPPNGSIPLPVIGSALIRGTVTDPQGQPFTGAGAFVLLYRNSTHTFAGSTAFVPGVSAVNAPRTIGGGFAIPAGFFPAGAGVANGVGGTLNLPVAAAALDAGGNYCFGSGAVATGCPSVTVGGVANVLQAPLLPDSYLVTVIDDRPTLPLAGVVGCVPGFQPPAGGIGPAPCGSLPWTSQPVIAQADRVVTVNVQLQAKFAPGVPAPIPGVLGGAAGVFGVLWDASVPGGRPIQGGTVRGIVPGVL